MKRSSTLLKGVPSLPVKNLQISKPPSPQLAEKDESFNDQSVDNINGSVKEEKTKYTRYSRASKKSRSVMLSETSEPLSVAARYPRITKVRNSRWYQLVYFICYYFLALNDHFRILILKKNLDPIYLVFTIFFCLLFVADIITRAIIEAGYFLRFFFFVD